jgi:hypothetical protein
VVASTGAGVGGEIIDRGDAGQITPARADDDWSQRARITPGESGREGGVGDSIALNGDTALVGGTGGDSGEREAGASDPADGGTDGLPTDPGEPNFGGVLGVIRAFNTNSEYADTGVTPGFRDVLAVIRAFNTG